MEGIVEAPEPGVATRILRERNLFVLDIRRRRREPTGKPLAGQELSFLARQLGVCLACGIPIVEALDLAAEISGSRRVRRAVEVLATGVRQGMALHASMEVSGVFPRMFVESVRAGERSGSLPAVLQRLAASLDREIAFRRKVTAALTYPSLVMAVTVMVVAVFLTVVVPQLASMLAAFHTPLPLPTRIMIAASSHVPRVAVPAAAVATLLVGIWWMWRDRPSMQRVTERLIRSIPFAGTVTSFYTGARTARILGTLVGAAVPILESIAITSDACGSRIVADALARAGAHVRDGGKLAEALEGAPFPRLLVHMIALGEATGDIAGLLNHAAEALEQEVDHRTGQLTALLEPAAAVGMGVIIGGILLSMYLPILRLIQAIQ